MVYTWLIGNERGSKLYARKVFRFFLNGGNGGHIEGHVVDLLVGDG